MSEQSELLPRDSEGDTEPWAACASIHRQSLRVARSGRYEMPLRPYVWGQSNPALRPLVSGNRWQ